MDLGKIYVHMIGLDSEGRIALRRRVRRGRLVAEVQREAAERIDNALRAIQDN